MYQQRACSAAALHSEDLRSCPQADCQGIAVKEAGTLWQLAIASHLCF